MRSVFLLFVLAIMSASGSSQTSASPAVPSQQPHTLMPVPAKVEFQPGAFRLLPSLTVAITGAKDERVDRAVHRALRRLEGRTGLTLPRSYRAAPEQSRLLISFDQPGKETPALDENESYSLRASAERVTIRAATAIGALRAIETLLQLVLQDGAGYFVPAVNIEDEPRFRWRGLMIDSGRHFQPLEVLKRNLDGMAAVKLNVLHWHLTEDQGFRIESKRYPRLHLLGSDGNFYTQEEVREIIAYARERGIRVVPEFDMPGHTQSWLVGYPELAASPGPHAISRTWGIMDAAFDPVREETYKFLDGFLGEMAKLFPDAYMHIGGDENNGKWWDANPKIQEFKQRKGIKDNHALQTYFSRRIQKIVTKHGKRMMGWDEILQPDLPKDVVVHSWRGTEALAAAAKQGYDGVLSAPYYIDLMHPAAKHYSADIIPANSDLTSEQRRHVLGGEATMWSELVTPENIDSRIWPRTAAIAERFWSPAEVRDIDDMYRRLATTNLQLEELGLTHIKSSEAILRGLVNSTETADLRALLATLAPVQGYRRQSLQELGAFSPLTGLVDAASPDSAEVRRFNAAVEDLLARAPGFPQTPGELETMLGSWQQLERRIKTMAASRPRLQEAAASATDLSSVAAAAIEALAYLRSRTPPPGSWLQSRLPALEEAAKPKGALELAILPAARELVFAAAELSSLQPTNREDWRRRVKQLANPPQSTQD